MTTVGIVGAGTVGSYFAAACTAAGITVIVADLDHDCACSLVRSLPHSERASAVESITDPAGFDVLVEAVPEVRSVKIDVLTRLTGRADALLVTTTSAFTVTELAAALPQPERLVGVHVMPATPHGNLAEIAAGSRSDEAYVAKARMLATSLGWTPLDVRDRPGRLTRRLVLPFFHQVVQALDDGLASAADIDRVVTLGLGHRRGPLAVLDSTGLDDQLATSEAMFDALHDPAIAPPPLLAHLVAAGQFGDKTGAGFFVEKQQ
ncbi:3-hydroxyacyl-CoA dehydrogenase family protein [Nocardia sp. CA-107356]|uniref:3-hydroxyacyl-CoA dehydrogenase family protein n=1 Tax=Nocardia sp. CA-107356 TaxID=3239972 RepID=UPI003D902784